MAIGIPAWLVGTIGASIVAIGSLAHALTSLNLDQEIRDTRMELLDIRSRRENSWGSHILAEDRWIAGEILNDNRRLQDAIVTMAASAGKDDPEVIFQEINNTNKISELSGILDKYRLQSQKYNNSLLKNQRKVEALINKYESQRAVNLWLFNILNFVGVTILLLKDLPVWRQYSKKAT